MDIQTIIALNVLGLALAGALLPLVYRPPGHGWMALVSTIVVIVAGGALLFAQQWAGTIAAVVFVPLILLPTIFASLSARSTVRGRARQAATYARLFALFHPTPRARFNAAAIAAQAHEDIEARAVALRELARSATPEQRLTLQTLELRQRGDWAGIVSLLRDRPAANRELPGLLIRALGEVGRHDDMLQTYEITRESLSPGDLLVSQLFVASFCGRPATVDKILEIPALAALKAEAKDYWKAIAARNAGGEASAWRGTLETLSQTGTEPSARAAAARQLAQSATLLPELEPASKAILQRIEGRIARMTMAAKPVRKAPVAGPWGAEKAPPVPVRPARGRPATYALLAVIAVVYVVEEARGGAQNLRALVDMGALWPQYVLQRGEWWRLLTAMFLHFGPLHAGLNGLMLFLLGRTFEARFGSVRLLLVFLLGGLISTSFVLWTMWVGISRPAVMVGASGAIFAVFGFEVAWQLVSWLRTRDGSDARGLASAAIVLAIQVAIDMSIPEISFAAHASGFFAGVGLGVVAAVMALRSRAVSPA